MNQWIYASEYIGWSSGVQETKLAAIKLAEVWLGKAPNGDPWGGIDFWGVDNLSEYFYEVFWEKLWTVPGEFERCSQSQWAYGCETGRASWFQLQGLPYVSRKEEIEQWRQEFIRKQNKREWYREMAFNYNGKRNDEIEWMSRMAKLPPELLFMHEMMFSEDEKVDNIDLEYKAAGWWDEPLTDEEIIAMSQAEDRAKHYLNTSERV